MIDFVGFPKIPRLSRECIVTEKIDGTNAQIYIGEMSEPFTLKSGRVVPFMVGSRRKWIFPEQDNAGFARWAYDHAEELLQLGPGHHFGEWWGQGIQRGYGLKEKRFSLFNTLRWSDPDVRPKCCYVVPALWGGTFEKLPIDGILELLRCFGSAAAPGFMKPEGIVIYHVAGNVAFKKTLESDDKPKGSKEE